MHEMCRLSEQEVGLQRAGQKQYAAVPPGWALSERSQPRSCLSVMSAILQMLGMSRAAPQPASRSSGAAAAAGGGEAGGADGRQVERAASFPRPPALQKVDRHLRVLLGGEVCGFCGGGHRPRLPAQRQRQLCAAPHLPSAVLPPPVPCCCILFLRGGLTVWLQVIADTRGAYRVLETHHPPTYYLPPSDVNTQLLTRSPGASARLCEPRSAAQCNMCAAARAAASAPLQAAARCCRQRAADIEACRRHYILRVEGGGHLLGCDDAWRADSQAQVSASMAWRGCAVQGGTGMQGVRRLPGQPPSQVVAQSKLPRARCPAHGLMHRRVWSYERPTERFEPIAGYFSFYAIPFECWVDEERVQAQVGHPARAVVGAVLGAGAQARRPRPLAAGCLHGCLCRRSCAGIMLSCKVSSHSCQTADRRRCCWYAAAPPLPLQDGSFYGGWVTADVEGPFKGGPGTAGW